MNISYISFVFLVLRGEGISHMASITMAPDLKGACHTGVICECPYMLAAPYYVNES